jgi:hypothetical protein
MDATANFSLRFGRPSESKVETLDWLLSRQTLQRISTGISLISLALGFWVFAMLIIISPALGRPECSCRWQYRCNDRRRRRYFSGYGFPCCDLPPLEVLRQKFSCPAGRAPVRPFHFRQTRACAISLEMPDQ